MVEHREGGDPSTQSQVARVSKSRGDYTERGVTPTIRPSDNGRTGDLEFPAQAWVRRRQLQDFGKDIIIELYNEAGQLAIACKVFRCWVSESHQLQPDLGCQCQRRGGSKPLKLENEGWERDYEVVEPSSPPSWNHEHSGTRSRFRPCPPPPC